METSVRSSGVLSCVCFAKVPKEKNMLLKCAECIEYSYAISAGFFPELIYIYSAGTHPRGRVNHWHHACWVLGGRDFECGRSNVSMLSLHPVVHRALHGIDLYKYFTTYAMDGAFILSLWHHTKTTKQNKKATTRIHTSHTLTVTKGPE